MKQIFTLLASALLSASVFAAEVKSSSSLLVRTTGNTDIRVLVDGKRFEPSYNSIMITNLRDGKHDVKIFKERYSNIYSNNNKQFDMIYSGIVTLRKRVSTVLNVDRNNRISLSENRDQDDRNRDNDYAYGEQDRFDFEEGGYGDYGYNEAYVTSMNTRDFNRVLAQINKEWLESNKLKSATQVISSSNLNTAQVKQLMQLFGFENNKLQVAKLAYRNTVDKQNYRQLVNMLTFRNHQVELEQYIRSGR